MAEDELINTEQTEEQTEDIEEEPAKLNPDDFSEEVQALAQFLNCELDEITEEGSNWFGNADVFSYGNAEYAVISENDIEHVFHEYAEDMIDEVVLPELPERYRSYFDYERFERDMSYDGYGQMSSYDGEDNEEKIGDTYYHIIRLN